jgi:hypothetical protein
MRVLQCTSGGVDRRARSKKEKGDQFKLTCCNLCAIVFFFYYYFMSFVRLILNIFNLRGCDEHIVNYLNIRSTMRLRWGVPKQFEGLFHFHLKAEFSKPHARARTINPNSYQYNYHSHFVFIIKQNLNL